MFEGAGGAVGYAIGREFSSSLSDETRKQFRMVAIPSLLACLTVVLAPPGLIAFWWAANRAGAKDGVPVPLAMHLIGVSGILLAVVPPVLMVAG